jgi:hypothetical protein
MARREYTINLWCVEPGCKEHSFSVAETRAEEREIRQRYAKNPYRCTRHSNPDRVLGVDNPVRTTTLTVEEVYRTDYRGERKLLGLYWRREGETEAHSGYAYGEGFNAFAKDFPPGTKLTIRAELELPRENEAAKTHRRTESYERGAG